MRIGSLFSGAGGLDLAVQAVFGGEVVWHAEIDKAASKVLAHRFPGVPNLGDITQVNWENWKPALAVDVLCGGFPCQDVSAAGKRAGIKDGTRSGLWAVFADAIDALRPQWVVIENVRGLLSATAHRTVEEDEQSGDMESATAALGNRTGRPILRAAGAVLGDLCDLGYDAQWATVAAADVGAPHRRERVFILAQDATSSSNRTEAGYQAGRAEAIRSASGTRGSSDRFVALSGGAAVRQQPGGASSAEAGAHPGDRFGDHRGERADELALLLPTPTADPFTSRSGDRIGELGLAGVVQTFLPTPSTHDTTGARSPESIAKMDKPFSNLNDIAVNELLSTPQARDSKGAPKDAFNQACLPRDIIDCDVAWGKYEPAIRRWEALTRPAPKPTEPGVSGLKRPRLNPQFSEWMMGWPAGWVTDIGLTRKQQLQIVGNGVVPQQAAAALRFLLSVGA